MSDPRITCDSLPQALAELLGDEGSSATRAGLRRHTAVCSSCASLVHGLDDALEAARSVVVPEPPPEYWRGFRSELRRRIDADQPVAWRVNGAAWLRAAFATASLAALSLAFIYRPPTEPVLIATDTATAEQIYDIAQALDHLTVDQTAFDEETEALQLEDLLAPSTNDLFALYDLAFELSDDLDASLDDILDELPG